MSSVTRAGFTVPDVTDFGDETLYYDNNVTVYEAELPSSLVAALPGSGNYNGRVRVIDTPQSSSLPAPHMPYDEWLYNGGWIRASPDGMKTNLQLVELTASNNTFISTAGFPGGTEIFDPSPFPGLTSVQGYTGCILKFCVLGHLNLLNSGDGSANAVFSIFLNPNSGSQPTPTTAGAVRLQKSITFGNDSQLIVGGGDDNGNFTEHFYGEMLYACPTNIVMGAAAYFSVINQPNYLSCIDAEAYTAPQSANINSSGLQISIETLGVFSG